MTIKQQGGIFGRNPTFNDVDVDSSINLGDGVKLNFGDGDDLVIQHQGSYSIIEDKGTGNLLIKGTNLQLKSYSTNEMYIEMTENGAVDLYHNGVKQAYTSSVGLAFPDGKGIDFSATSGTGTSELFSDYEEGTFSPTLRGATTDPTQSYLYQYGRYTKIGNRVYVSIVVGLQGAGITVGSGNASIDGLPFAIPSGIQYTSACSVEGRFWQTTNLGAPTSGRFEPGGTTISLWVYENSGGKAGSSTNANAADMDDTARVYLSGFYEV